MRSSSVKNILYKTNDHSQVICSFVSQLTIFMLSKIPCKYNILYNL